MLLSLIAGYARDLLFIIPTSIDTIIIRKLINEIGRYSYHRALLFRWLFLEHETGLKINQVTIIRRRSFYYQNNEKRGYYWYTALEYSTVAFCLIGGAPQISILTWIQRPLTSWFS